MSDKQFTREEGEVNKEERAAKRRGHDSRSNSPVEKVRRSREEYHSKERSRSHKHKSSHSHSSHKRRSRDSEEREVRSSHKSRTKDRKYRDERSRSRSWEGVGKKKRH